MAQLIYRVETCDGQGMYRGVTSVSDQMYDTDYEGCRHPRPSDDMSLDWDCNPEWIFGFGSLDQLKFWIYRTEWRKQMHIDGLKVYVYLPNTYRVGDTQAIFIRDCNPIATIYLIDL